VPSSSYSKSKPRLRKGGPYDARERDVALKIEGAKSEANLLARIAGGGGDTEERRRAEEPRAERQKAPAEAEEHVVLSTAMPARLDLDRFLQQARANRTSTDRHLEKVRHQLCDSTPQAAGPVPSWVYEKMEERRRRPVGGRHTTGLCRNETQEARGAEDLQRLRRTSSAGRLRAIVDRGCEGADRALVGVGVGGDARKASRNCQAAAGRKMPTSAPGSAPTAHLVPALAG
jgi:hypothetical protein